MVIVEPGPHQSRCGAGIFIPSLVGDINPFVGRGYLSPTNLSAEMSPPHHRTSQPPRAEQDECPWRCFDGDTYPRRTARWSGIFIPPLVGDIYPRPIFPRRCLRPRGEGITEQRPPNLRLAFLYLLTATIAPLNSASPDSSIRNPRLWATCTRPLSTFKKIFRHG